MKSTSLLSCCSKIVLSSAMLTLVTIGNVFAGPSVSLYCLDDNNSQRILMAFDLDPKERIYDIRGKHSSLVAASKSSNFTLMIDSRRPFHTEVVSYASTSVDLIIKSDEGDLPIIMVASNETHRPLHFEKVFGMLKGIKITNNGSERIDFFDSRKAAATLYLEDLSSTPLALEYTNCSFEGAHVDDWNKMWNRQ
ncbi:MAG: hypothetical protein HQK52_17915 [Oligoflexia bacterium]|nr:hypothetical protein [Oligoflexia bacterium]